MKPASKSSDKDRKDVDKAMRRVKEASSIIEDEIDPGMSYLVSILKIHRLIDIFILFKDIPALE